MEINLTAIGDTLTAPFRWLAHRVNRGHSRFNRMNPQKRLQTVKLMRLLALGSVVGAVLMMVLFFVAFAWFSRELPKPGEIVRREGFSTRIYDRNGQLLYDLFDTERRVPISIAQVPEDLKHATVAVEDKDFYKHGGFDVLTILRIPYNIVFKQRVVGGSTLTQQLVKNVFLTNERSVVRKFKEIVLSIQIERKFSKDQILEMYLNEAPYGGTAWGVGTASEVYFNKPVSQLNLVESAILAGLPQRPSAYSPYTGKSDESGTPLWKVRARGVLRRMREDGFITEAAFTQASTDLDTVQFQRAAAEIKAPHFVFYVRDKLVEMYGEEVAERGGFKVTTTLDSDLQNQAQTVVKEEIDKVTDFHITNGSAVVMDPRNGEILGMVGSKDYFAEDIDGQFNVAVDGLRQPGSSIKPVTYLAMFQRGFTPASILMDVDTTFRANANNPGEKPYQPRNYDGKFHGPVNLRNSLGSSLNIPAVKSMGIVGIDNFLNLAYSMGFNTLEPSPENLKRFGLSLTLGGGEVHLIDTVSAYSAFANGGHKIEPVSILKVEDKDGKTVFEHRAVQGPEVIKPEEAFLINNILSDNTARLMAFGANSLLNTGKPIAVKTGTTNEQKDNWTIGWSQEVMVGVWVGNNDNTSMTRVASGITGASPIWRRIINYALEKGYKAPEWVVPPNVEQVDVDELSGYPKHDEFPSRKEWVIKGTLPITPDPIHTKLKLCRGENKLATDAKISVGDFDEREFIVLREDDPVSQDGVNRWQEGINAWINGQTDTRYKPPTEYCGEQSDVTIRLVKPENEKVYSETNIEVEVEAGSGDGIEKIEIWVDGGLRETINDRKYKGFISMSAGQHEIFAKAKSRSGKEVQSGTVRIGTGGQDWKKSDPSPTPSPSPTASPGSGGVLPPGLEKKDD
jgi:penicillin-binding protein 1C